LSELRKKQKVVFFMKHHVVHRDKKRSSLEVWRKPSKIRKRKLLWNS